MARSSVDLPEPEGPISATISPRWTLSDTPASARRAPKVLEMPRTRRTAASDGMATPKVARRRWLSRLRRGARRFHDGAGAAADRRTRNLKQEMVLYIPAVFPISHGSGGPEVLTSAANAGLGSTICRGLRELHTYHTPLDLVRERSPERPVALVRPDAVALAARWFQDNFKGDVLYAVKANPSPWVIKTLAANGVARVRRGLDPRDRAGGGACAGRAHGLHASGEEPHGDRPGLLRPRRAHLRVRHP